MSQFVVDLGSMSFGVLWEGADGAGMVPQEGNGGRVGAPAPVHAP